MKRKLLLVVFSIAALWILAGCNKPDAGEIGVVRNGGSYDNKDIRTESGKDGVLCPGSKAAWNGWGSETHKYPDSRTQRQYRLARTNKDGDLPDKVDAEAQPVRTKDGVTVWVTGTYFFKTGFDCTAQGIKLLKAFDNQFTNRPEGQRPFDSWQGWLEATVEPIIDRTQREVISKVNCAQLVTSCQLRGGQNVSQEALERGDNATNIAQVERELQTALDQRLTEQFGGKDQLHYFDQITFNLQSVPTEVDPQIRKAQGAFAQVADIRAQVEKEKQGVQLAIQTRKKNEEKAKGYARCAACADQDRLKVLGAALHQLPPNLQSLDSRAIVNLGK